MLLGSLSLRDIHRYRSFYREGESCCEKVARAKNEALAALAPTVLKEPLRDQRVLERLNERGTAEFRVDRHLFHAIGPDVAIAGLQHVWRGQLVVRETTRTAHCVRLELTYAPN